MTYQFHFLEDRKAFIREVSESEEIVPQIGPTMSTRNELRTEPALSTKPIYLSFNIYLSIFTIVISNGINPRYPMTDEWIMKGLYKYTTAECYAIASNDEIMIP